MYMTQTHTHTHNMSWAGWKQCLSDICEPVPEVLCWGSSCTCSHTCCSLDLLTPTQVCSALLGQDSHCFKIPVRSYSSCLIVRSCPFSALTLGNVPRVLSSNALLTTSASLKSPMLSFRLTRSVYSLVVLCCH